VLQRFDLDRDKARAKFDLERDEAQRKFQAALSGVQLKDNPVNPSKPPKPSAANGQKRRMTKQDITRSYGS
jgi:hypothetical protein